MATVTRKNALGAVALVAGVYALSLISGVSAEDVAAKEEVATQLAVVTVLKAPGDIFAVSADGQSVERICGFNFEPAPEPSEPRRIRYFNTLSEMLPFVKPAEVSMEARIELLDRERTTSFDEDCACRLVEQVNHRRTLCQSSKLVMQVNGGEAIPFAAALRRDALYLGEAVFAGCGMEFSPAADQQATQCPVEFKPQWSARLRETLNVIEREIH